VHRRIALCFLLVATALFGAGSGRAAPRDAAANQKIEEAINTHYLATEFDKAEALLKGVLEACEDRCSPSVKGRAWMYVGIVRGSGKQDVAGAQEAFKQALATDPAVKLDDALATPPVRQAFAAAGGSAGAPAAAPKAEAAKGATAAEVAGNMECTPTVTEVEQQRPIPVACTTDEPATNVVLHYMGFGGEQWQQVQLTKKGEYWQGEIPCNETGNVGKLKFYVQAKDKDGEELDAHGNKKEPAEISIVAHTEEEPPSYPGETAPAKCMEASACPDDMIGTPACPGTAKKGRGNKGWGAACDTSQECDSGLLCTQGDNGRTCETAPSCEGQNDCPSGAVCKNGQCDVADEGGAEAAGPYKKNLLGLHFAADFGFLSGHDVCAPGSNFNCFYGNGAPYNGQPRAGGGGNLNGGAPRVRVQWRTEGSERNGVPTPPRRGPREILVHEERFLEARHTPVRVARGWYCSGRHQTHGHGLRVEHHRPEDGEARATKDRRLPQARAIVHCGGRRRYVRVHSKARSRPQFEPHVHARLVGTGHRTVTRVRAEPLRSVGPPGPAFLRRRPPIAQAARRWYSVGGARRRSTRGTRGSSLGPPRARRTLRSDRSVGRFAARSERPRPVDRGVRREHCRPTRSVFSPRNEYPGAASRAFERGKTPTRRSRGYCRHLHAMRPPP
jgi:hypothetical protein